MAAQTHHAFFDDRGRRPLAGPQLADFKTLVEHYAKEIVNKWVDYFVLHKPIEPKRIK
jgi:hypothetical protein